MSGQQQQQQGKRKPTYKINVVEKGPDIVLARIERHATQAHEQLVGHERVIAGAAGARPAAAAAAAVPARVLLGVRHLPLVLLARDLEDLELALAHALVLARERPLQVQLRLHLAQLLRLQRRRRLLHAVAHARGRDGRGRGRREPHELHVVEHRLQLALVELHRQAVDLQEVALNIRGCLNKTIYGCLDIWQVFSTTEQF